VLAKAAMRIAPRAVLRRRLAGRLTAFWRSQLRLSHAAVRVTVSDASPQHPHRVMIARSGARIEISCSEHLIVARAGEAFHRLCGILVAAGALDEYRFVADVSDGEDSGPGIVSFCSREADAVLIPDHVFIRTRGYESDRGLARANATAWRDRSDRIVWRGSTTGAGVISKPELVSSDRELLPRVRLCLMLRDAPDTDVRLTAVAQSRDVVLDRARLAQAGILGDYVQPITWHGCKFAIDIDGNSNAWSNLFTRLIMGCCVLKVGSAPGFRQWYYGGLEPWAHYVPVRADLSDLPERIAWCRANPAACGEIAARGQAFAMALDFRSELEAAARRIREARARGALRTTMG